MSARLTEITGQSVLAGALEGRRVLGSLLTAAENEPEAAEPFFIDFTGIEVATASFLRESVLAFRYIIRGRRSNLYPVIANASNVVLEEFMALVRLSGGVIMICELDETGKVSNPAFIGDLDPKQRVTFDLVRERGETDAGELMRDFRETEHIGQSAWNNRLASLASLGLVVEITQGRFKRYKPLFEGA